MGGGDGTVIIHDNTASTLGNPVVSGQLPPDMSASIQPILARDPTTWNGGDKKTLAKAYSWALCNL